jgi:hypothetical protein
LYNVSEQYKLDTDLQIRNQSYLKVNFSIVNVDAKSTAILTTQDESPYSDVSGVKIDNFIGKRYSTMEPNHSVLDNNNLLLEQSQQPIFQGYVSGTTSDGDCDLKYNPIIAVNYPSPLLLSGLSFVFDEVRGDYPTSIEITSFLGGTIVSNDIVLVDSVFYVYDKPIPNHDTINIRFIGTSTPYQRVKLSNIVFGISKFYTSNDIVSSKQTSKVDLISSVLPVDDFSFTIFDLNQLYNPENPTGLFSSIRDRQSVRFEYGYELSDGSIEWVLGGLHYTTGDVKIDSNAIIPTVEISSTSTIHFLDDLYEKGVYSSTPKPLSQLVSELLDGYDVFYTIDSSLDDIYTTAPLPIDSIKNNLQLISNSAMCTLLVDRDGSIIISKVNFDDLNGESDFDFTKDKLYKIPFANTIPTLKSISSVVHTYTPSTTSDVIAKFDVSSPSVAVKYKFKYDLSTEVLHTTSASLFTVDTPKYYGGVAEVTLIGFGTITFTGKKISENEFIKTLNVNEKGVECDVKNKLITNEPWLVSYMDWISQYLSFTNTYSFSNRGYCELDLLDVVGVDTLYTEKLNSFVIENNISYNGAISGETKVLPKIIGG